MIRYTIERLVWMFPTMLAMSLIIFVIMHATPGSPLDPLAANANPLTPQAQANMARHYGLDKPLHEQYLTFLWNVLHLDFGISYVQKDREVSTIIQNTFPISLVLGTLALIFATAIGLTLGIVAAMRQNSWVDYLATAISMLAVSTPNFVVGVLLIVVVALGLNLLPIAMTSADLFDPWSVQYWSKNWTFWILPTITLGVGPLATIARYTRASMIDVIRSDFVRTARAKGLLEGAVVMRHVLKNALIPVVTIIGPL
ncbi:MAG: ABC transporter permease, partial [Chloroflexi bacterium]|nr:ABC transporter permease [Chloroflexota bacterium]